MHKNQLQELAQRSCFNLPAYSCIREGPDHAPRFKATVNFNGEIFESPNYCSTLRQAEHAAAEVALNTLSKRGPSHSLASRILDETGVCKNLLQETAQRAGVSLPVYKTIRSGPGHLPIFECIVEVAGMTFKGDPAKTKKQAEKNAALAAWSALKQRINSGSSSLVPSLDATAHSEEDQKYEPYTACSTRRREDRVALSSGTHLLQSSQLPMTQNVRGLPRVKVVNTRDRSRHRDGSLAEPFLAQSSVPSTSGEVISETGQFHRAVFNQQYTVGGSRISSSYGSIMHQHSHSIPPALEPPMLSRDSQAASRVVAVTASGIPAPVRIRGLPMNSRSERRIIELPLEEHQKDEDEWLGQESAKVKLDGRGSDLHDADKKPYNIMMQSRFSQWWGSQPQIAADAAAFANALGLRTPSSVAPPVRVRQMVPVCSAPPRRFDAPQVGDDVSEVEATTCEVLSRLRL